MGWRLCQWLGGTAAALLGLAACAVPTGTPLPGATAAVPAAAGTPGETAVPGAAVAGTPGAAVPGATAVLGPTAAVPAAAGMPGTTAAVPAAPVPAVRGFGAAVSGDNALRVEVTVELERPGRVLVEYGNEAAGRFRTPLGEVAAAHKIRVVRLRAETTYDYAIGVADGAGAVAFAARGEFTTGRLPEVLDTMGIAVRGRSSQPLILTDYSVTTRRRAAVRYLVMHDAAGQIVWYQADIDAGPLAAGDTGSLQRIVRKDNGNLVYMIRNCCIREITPWGELVAELAGGTDSGNGIPHHALLPLVDGRVLYLADTIAVFDDSGNGGPRESRAVYDTLRVWAPDTGGSRELWSALDFWDIADGEERVVWRRNRRRWTHGNSLALGPRGNLIMSLRNRNQIVSLSPDLRSIEWQLGGPGSDYSFPNAADRFYRQHTATQLANGNILLFDNGLERPEEEGGAYSRALELRLDGKRGTAVKVWEYRAEPDLFAAIRSSAYRLENGNTLVNFGSVEDWEREPLTVVEVDGEGREVFRMETIDPARAADAELGPRRGRAYGDIRSIWGERQLGAGRVGIDG